MGKRPETLEKRWDIAGKILVALFGLFLLWIACFGEIRYAEIDSNALPVISLQYRGSMFVEPGDIELARRDFPTLYGSIYTYDDLRSSKLLQITPSKWMSYYFPIYPFLCIPFKLLLTLFHRNQAYCFSITNALLMFLALAFLQCKLKVSAKQRLIGCVLLMLSPALFYIPYINYEIFMLSFLTLSLVQYCNAHYKSSALLLALAGMPNPTVMAIGIVMIAIYLYQKIQTARKNPWDFPHFIGYAKETVCYGLYYVPCLIPFIVQKIYLGGAVFSASGGNDKYFFARFLSYLFDPTVGFPSFAPLQLILFFALVAVSCLHKKPIALIWLAFLLGVVAAYSLMRHINCGMIYCSRYLIWSYPVIAVFLATAGYQAIQTEAVKNVLYVLCVSTCGLFLHLNVETAYNPHLYNTVTQWILNTAPQIYNPYSATFYCRVLHIDGGYDITKPAYYTDPYDDSIRKLIFVAAEGQAEEVMDDLGGDTESEAYLYQQLKRYGTDGKYHYVDFPRHGRYQVHEKTPLESGDYSELKQVINLQDYVLAEGEVLNLPLTIQGNVMYEFLLDLGNVKDYSDIAGMVVDFYTVGYDNIEQQKDTFICPNRDKYTFFLNTGELPEETLDVAVRIFNYGNAVEVPIDSFVVTELQKTA